MFVFPKITPVDTLKQTQLFLMVETFEPGVWEKTKITRYQGTCGLGVSSGEDFAISDQSYKIEEYDDESGQIEIAGSTISHNNAAEREDLSSVRFVKQRKHLLENGAQYIVSNIVALASSSSADALMDTKYELNTTLATYEEALSVAMSKNGYLLQIKDAAENELLQEWLLSKANDNLLTEGVLMRIMLH